MNLFEGGQLRSHRLSRELLADVPVAAQLGERDLFAAFLQARRALFVDLVHAVRAGHPFPVVG